MPFKIVSTKSRRGGIDISLCPSLWEEGGVLMWPPKNVTRLQTDGDSEPEPHWRKYQCEVKKSDVTTYEDALNWEKAYQNIDTDGEADLTIEASTQRRQRGNPIPNKNSIDDMFDSIIDLENNALHTSQSALLLEEPVTSPSLAQNTALETGATANEIPCITISADIISAEDFRQFKEEVHQEFEQIHKEISEFRQSVLAHQNQQFLKIQVMLEKMLQQQHITKEIEPSSSEMEIFAQELIKLPINDVDELAKFDHTLATNAKYKMDMEQHFVSIFGNDGQGRAELLGKKMADAILTKSVLTKYSWTGVSRTIGQEKKLPFQPLSAITALFCSVLTKADSRWNKQKNDKLFSCVLLKHAKKRAQAERAKLEKVLLTTGQNMENEGVLSSTSGQIVDNEGAPSATVPAI